VDEQERLLRDTLHDDRWALPSRPDATARLHRRARAQAVRRRAAIAVVVVLLLVAVVLPLSLGRHGGRAQLTTVGPSPTATRTGLPAPGAAFPADVYPPPVPIAPGSGGGSILTCPNPVGLQPPGEPSRAEVTAALSLLARGTSSPLDTELAGLDRTEWTQYAASRADDGPAGSIHLLDAAPLLAGDFSNGPPDFAAPITAACGAATAADSYAAVEGPANSPALAELYVFVRRGGRLLVYFEYP
jgi:hypothetical protein